MALYTLSLMIGTAGLPHVIIRFFTVPKVADARWSAGWALVFIATAVPHGSGRGCDGAPEHHHHHVAGRSAGRSRAAVEELPDWFDTWEVTGLLGVEDKNGDGRIQYYNRGRATTSLSPSTVTSSCWPTRKSHSFRAG
jgi:cation/acetate symporter